LLNSRPVHRVASRQVVSCGATLEAWVSALRATGGCASVTAVQWDTKQPPVLRREQEHGAAGSDAAAAAAAAGGARPEPSWPVAAHEASSGARCVRVFVFGMDKVRRRARATLGKQWDDQHDWFAA
jgi:hypothetical protein